MLRMLLGIRLGVNCMCWNCSFNVWLSDCINRVLLSLGVFFSR